MADASTTIVTLWEAAMFKGSGIRTVTLVLASAGCTSAAFDASAPDLGPPIVPPVMRGDARRADGGPGGLDAVHAVDASGASDTGDGSDAAGGVQGDGASGSDAVAGDGGSPDAQVAPVAFDVVVVGAGPAGIAAAIQAARLQSKVVLIEASEWLGGQLTAAAGSAIGAGKQLPNGSGLFKAFKEAIKADYAERGKSIHACRWADNATCFEPHVGRRILRRMLEKAGVAVRLNLGVSAVQRQGQRVVGIKLSNGQSYRSKVLIDASDRGDAIALSGASYRVANARNNVIDQDACISDITYAAVVKRYPEGIPAALRMHSTPPDYEIFRPIIARYLSDQGSSDAQRLPVAWSTYAGHSALPDSSNPDDTFAILAPSKTVLNWANVYPGPYAADLPTSRVTAAYLERAGVRKEIDCQAKLMTLSHIYYLQHELGLPWSVANDEGYNTAQNRSRACGVVPAVFKALERHLPAAVQVRESRRIVALQTLTAKDLKPGTGNPKLSATNFSTSVAVGEDAADLQSCSTAADLDSDLDEKPSDSSAGGRAFQVPFGALIPVATNGLLAAGKTIGVSRLVAAAIHQPPIAMATGQAAGAIAALAVSQDKQPRQVSPLAVQQVLVQAGSAIARQQYLDIDDQILWGDVQLVLAQELMSGWANAYFAPSRQLDRESAAVALARLLGIDLSTPPKTQWYLADVFNGRPSYAAIVALIDGEIVDPCIASGYVRYFCPTTVMKRGELVAAIVRGLGVSTPPQPATPVYDDVSADHPYYREIQQAAAAGLLGPEGGLLDGCARAPGSKFCPQSPVTYGAAATIFARVLSLR